MAAQLDHIIVLVPHAHLLSPPTWLTDNFTLTPGGRHSDNKTENKLICFKDGSYIELISFINDDPALRHGHWWGKKPFGIIDFAFTSLSSSAAENHEAISSRLSAITWEKDEIAVMYQQPIAGGRKRPDGVDVKWQVTFPKVSDDGYQRGALPFFCHDVTERDVRVPFSKESTTHPSGVFGVRQLSIFVPGSRVKTLSKAYSAVLRVAERGVNGGLFETEPIHANPTDSNFKAGFQVKEPVKRWQREAMEQRGGLFLGSLSFWKEGRKSLGTMTRIDAGEEDLGMGGWWLSEVEKTTE